MKGLEKDYYFGFTNELLQSWWFGNLKDEPEWKRTFCYFMSLYLIINKE